MEEGSLKQQRQIGPQSLVPPACFILSLEGHSLLLRWCHTSWFNFILYLSNTYASVQPHLKESSSELRDMFGVKLMIVCSLCITLQQVIMTYLTLTTTVSQVTSQQPALTLEWVWVHSNDLLTPVGVRDSSGKKEACIWSQAFNCLFQQCTRSLIERGF